MQPEHKSDQVFQIGVDLAEKIVVNVKSLTALDEEELAYKGSMFFFFCKAYKSYQAIRVLWREGFAEDAFILTRTIFELALQARYMKEDPKPRARLFAEQDPVMRYRYYLNLKKLGDADLTQGIEIENRKQELSELKQQYERHKAKYPEGKGWWGKSIAWLARHLGKEMEIRYVAIYWMQSNLAHSGTTSVKEYMADNKGGLKINCYPSHSDEKTFPLEATLHFLDIMGHTTESLGINLKDEVDKALEKFKKIVDAGGEKS